MSVSKGHDTHAAGLTHDFQSDFLAQGVLFDVLAQGRTEQFPRALAQAPECGATPHTAEEGTFHATLLLRIEHEILTRRRVEG